MHSLCKTIEDYALIGDGRSAALVARDGRIDWLCWPRFESDACLTSLLGDERHGMWRLAPTSAAKTSRSYCDDALVLQTDFITASGTARLTDFMPDGDDHSRAIVRRLEGLDGEVEFELALSLRFDYGRISPWFSPLSDPDVQGYRGEVGPDLVVLRGPRLQREGSVLRAHIILRSGDRADYVLQHAVYGRSLPEPIDVEAALAATKARSRQWISRFRKQTEWRNVIKRSLLTLKALTHSTTGGVAAAATLGLPETPHGCLNWDYRYCWLRDSTFTLTAFLNAGFHEEARNWLGWLLRAVAGAPDKIQIVYRVDGGRDIMEREIDLPGFDGARPVRVGNAAYRQRQLDVFGEILDSINLCERAGIELDEDVFAICARLVSYVEQIWREPDQGMWESRGAPQHYVYSKAMAWVAVDRYLRLAIRRGGCSHTRRAELEALRDEIHAEVCEKGFDATERCFVQSYGSSRIDASVLLLPLVGFLPVDDGRISDTIATIESRLMEGGFVRRLPADDPEREEGAFLACSCWLADCMAMQGRAADARTLFERVLAVANDVGLLSEEYHVPSRRLVGNFPQALTHIAVINTGLGLCGPVLQRAAG